MKDVRYLAPATIPEAVQLLGEYGQDTMIVAGGTDAMVDLTLGRVQPPTYLMYIGNIREMDYVREDSGTIRIGALTTYRTLGRSRLLWDKATALAEIAVDIAAPPIQNLATLGGNIVRASPAGDSIPPLLVLEATVTLVGPGGSRQVPLDQFFTGPGQTVRAEDELLTEISFPVPGERTVSMFIRQGKRKALYLSVASASVCLTLVPGDGICEDARIALGAVAPTPIRAREAEKRLIGQPFDPGVIKAVAQTAVAESRPIDDGRASAWYRRQITDVLVRRALRGARERIED
ncbi:MAG: FAD binding domain-containing protein [Anaerolineae bacterium]